MDLAYYFLALLGSLTLLLGFLIARMPSGQMRQKQHPEIKISSKPEAPQPTHPTSLQLWQQSFEQASPKRSASGTSNG